METGKYLPWIAAATVDQATACGQFPSAEKLHVLKNDFSRILRLESRDGRHKQKGVARQPDARARSAEKMSSRAFASIARLLGSVAWAMASPSIRSRPMPATPSACSSAFGFQRGGVDAFARTDKYAAARAGVHTTYIALM